MVCEPHMALHGSKFNSQLPGKSTPTPFLEIGRKWKWNKRQPACFGSLVQPYILHRTSCLFHKRGRIIKNILSNHNTNWDEIIFKKTATSPLLQLFPTGPFYDSAHVHLATPTYATPIFTKSLPSMRVFVTYKNKQSVHHMYQCRKWLKPEAHF